jgi:hypothetical protein
MHILLCLCQLEDYCKQILVFEEFVTRLNIVTYRSIVRQLLGKHILAGAKERSNRTPIARQRFNNHASLIIEAVFSAWSVQSGYKEVFSSIK